MNGPLVSIITPCYNGENHVHRFLDSVLNQTYSNIELIFVNDGSIDKTEDILFSYNDRFIKKGIKLVYLFQENRGQASAINFGLKKVTGKYICWPDADDYLDNESVIDRLRFLEDYSEYAIVASDAFVWSEEHPEMPMGLISANYPESSDPDQFEHLLYGRSFICSGCYMVRTEAFFESHPSGQIFPSRSGQNYQMLLPLYYGYKRYFMNKALYNYIKSKNSHSDREYSAINNRETTYNHHKEIFIETMKAMLMPERQREYYQNVVRIRYSQLIFGLAYNNGNFESVHQEFVNLIKLKKVSIKITLKFLLAWCKKKFWFN